MLKYIYIICMFQEKLLDIHAIFVIGKLEKIKVVFFCLANRFFGFDIYVLIKGIRLSVWGTEDIKISGGNLTNINFTNIGMQIKFINTLKFYQKSLVQLAQAATDNGKISIAKITQQFLLQHEFFL